MQRYLRVTLVLFSILVTQTFLQVDASGAENKNAPDLSRKLEVQKILTKYNCFMANETSSQQPGSMPYFLSPEDVDKFGFVKFKSNGGKVMAVTFYESEDETVSSVVLGVTPKRKIESVDYTMYLYFPGGLLGMYDFESVQRAGSKGSLLGLELTYSDAKEGFLIRCDEGGRTLEDVLKKIVKSKNH